MNEEEQTKEALEKLKKSVNTMPEGLEMFEPANESSVKNINQQNQEKQFVAKDIGYSQNIESKKNEKYSGPVTQTSYDNGGISQSFNSSNTKVHKSHATRNKHIVLIVLIFAILAVSILGYYISSKASASGINY